MLGEIFCVFAFQHIIEALQEIECICVMTTLKKASEVSKTSKKFPTGGHACALGDRPPCPKSKHRTFPQISIKDSRGKNIILTEKVAW